MKQTSSLDETCLSESTSSSLEETHESLQSCNVSVQIINSISFTVSAGHGHLRPPQPRQEGAGKDDGWMEFIATRSWLQTSYVVQKNQCLTSETSSHLLFPCGKYLVSDWIRAINRYRNKHEVKQTEFKRRGHHKVQHGTEFAADGGGVVKKNTVQYSGQHVSTWWADILLKDITTHGLPLCHSCSLQLF